MEANPDLVDVNSTYDEGKPEAKIVIQRDKAALLGVSVEDLGKAIRALIGGQEISTFEEDGETYEVRVRLAKDQRARPEDVLNVPVRTRSGRTLSHWRIWSKSTRGPGPCRSIVRTDRVKSR
jgi:multidrug efflux pump subunit AcrB